jgi:hypothetical protein
LVNQPNQGGVDDDETDLLSSLEEMYLILELKTQQQQLFLVAAQQQQLFLDAAHQQKLFYDEQIDVLNILSLIGIISSLYKQAFIFDRGHPTFLD